VRFQKTKELERLGDINKKNASNLAKLIDTSQQMMRSLDVNEILKTMLENGHQLLDAEFGVVFTHDKKSNSLIPSMIFPKQAKINVKEMIINSENFLWKTYIDNEPKIIDLLKLSAEEVKLIGLNRHDTFSVVSLPISEKDYHLGVLVYLRNRKQPFRVEEVHLLSTLATETAILLDNKNLVKALEEKAESLENAYGELQRSQQQVIQLQKMESLGTLVGGIAHDFNNILGIILPNTDLIKNEANGNPTILRRANIIAEATQRAADLTRQLLMFSRNQDIQLQIISPNKLVMRLSEMFQRTLGKEYDILLDLDPKVEDIEGDENRLSQVLINLALNSRDSMPDGGEIAIRTRMAKYKPKSNSKSITKEYVCISITDSGCGIRSSDIDKIFDPFFTTKSVGKGTGLGLSVVYGIVQSHRGFVEVESEVNEGTTFYLYFPPARRKLSIETEDTGQEIPEGSETILIVDDEQMIRDSVKDILQSLGYAVFQASSGPAAIRLLDQKKYQIDLAIVDMAMPKMNGVETIRKIREIDKRIKILLSSGHSEREKSLPDDYVIDGILPKPYRMRELALKIRQVLNHKS
jgi:signal transduction histidine kinase/CheY-like chemotaxis protein